MSPVPPRVVVVGCSHDERVSRASRLARVFRVPHLPFAEAASGLAGDRGYVIDGFPDSMERLQAFMVVPADLVVHLRPTGSRHDCGPARVLDYYEARGVLAGFPPDADDEDIIIAIEVAVRSHTDTAAHLLR